ncbi:MAG: MarR family transcriptional regulator [Proteobacteria bacterium]|nr:MarR family transcriptional regulator [Pseudomonadota bacterium]
MDEEFTDLKALDIWRQALVSSVRLDVPDLSARQMGLLLSVYLTPPPHTVRGLAQVLAVSKPAITRAVNRLSELGLVRRKTDDADRRSVFIQRTVKGSVFLREFGELIVQAAEGKGVLDPSGLPPSY